MLPTIVLGIGGTGKWVILDLKRKLEGENRNIPREIFLKAFDVTENENPPVERFNFLYERGEYYPEQIRKGPLLSLFGVSSIDRIAAQIESRYVQLKEWMMQEDIEYQRTSTAQDVTQGAGRIRQASRISFFMHTDKSIYESLKVAFDQVAPIARSQNNPIRFFIVSSLAGGTGCGTFIDFALMAHSLLQGQNVDCYFYALFSLPRGFKAIKPTDRDFQLMQANCYAAWRELHRIQCYPYYTVNYSQSRRDIGIKGKRLFTWCYLIDGDALDSIAGLELKPQYGVNPSIAEFVHFILEGTIDQQERNWHEALTTAWTIPNWEANVYSSYGIHKWLVDLKDLKLTMAYKFGKETLEHFLRECPPGISRDLVQDFMKDARNTGFFKNIVYQLLEKGLKPQLNARNLFESLKLEGKEDASLPDPQLKEISIPLLVSRRKFIEIKGKADGKVKAKIGSKNDQWDKRRPTTYGALNYYFNEQMGEYKKFLQEFSKEILNHPERSLDYYRSFLEELVSVLNEVEEKLREIFDKHNIPGLKQAITKKLEDAEKKNKIKTYLRNLGNLFALQQLELLTEYYLDLIFEAREGANIMLQGANSMEESLQGRKTTLEKFQGKLHAYRAGLREIKIHSYITKPGDLNEENLFKVIFKFDSPEDGSVEKQIIDKTGTLDYKVFWQGIQWDFASDGSLKFIFPKEFPEISLKAQDWVSQFTQAILNETPFQNLSHLNIFDFLAFINKDVDQFVNELEEKSAYLAHLSIAKEAEWHKDSLEVPGREIVATDHKVIIFPPPTGEPGQMFFKSLFENDSFRDLSFSQNNTGDSSSILVCKITNFWSSNAFDFFTNTIEDYRTFIAQGTPPIHVLPEEKLAAKIYEPGLKEVLQEEIRLLHPTLIAYLKDEELLKAFTFARIYEEIKRDASTSQYTYEVKDPIGSRTINIGTTLIEALKKISDDPDAKKQLKNFYKETIKEKVGRIDDFIKELSDKFKEIKEKISSIDADDSFKPEEKELYRVFAVVLSREIDRFKSEKART